MIGAMEIPGFIDQLERHGVRLGEIVDGADLDAAVPSCPEWVVRDLVRHIGGIHRWATTFVSGRTEPIDADLDELVGGWPPDPELGEWYRAGHQVLVDRLREAPADLQCWTFLVAPSPLAMWSRRQAHETAIHRVDAELAVGERTGFDPDFAADGVDEILTAFITRPGRGPRSPEPKTIEVRCPDVGAAWWVSFDAGRCTTAPAGERADAVLSGPAADLYQVLWNRLPYEAVAVQGGRALIDLWRDTVHVRWS